MSKIFYLMVMLYTAYTVSAEHSLITAIAALTLAKNHYTLKSHDDFVSLPKVMEGDTIHTLIDPSSRIEETPIATDRMHIFFRLHTGNFTSNPSQDNTHMIHTMQPGTVNLKQVFLSYHPELKKGVSPWVRYEEDFNFTVFPRGTTSTLGK